jgi:hypothetical protein
MKKEWLIKTLAMGIIVLFIGMNTTYLVESHSIKDNSGISLITIQVEGELGLNNWYTSDVYFSFTKESEDIASIYYNNNNGWNEYIDPFVVHNDGEYALKWYAVNNEGNTSDIDGPFSFNIDQTKPTITLEYEVTGGNAVQGWEFTWTATATDSTSGMDRVEFYQNDILQETVAGPGPTYVWVMIYHPVPNVYFKVIGYDKAGNNDFFEIMDSSTNVTSLKSSRFISDISKETNIQRISNNFLPSEIVKSENHKIIEKLPSVYTNEDVFDPTYIIIVCYRILGGNGWIVSNISIPIFYESNRIADVFYQINDVGWKVYNEPPVISDDGVYVFSWYAVDSEGNISTPESTTFKIDKTPPNITLVKERLDESHIKFIANVTDELSGVSQVKFYLYNILKFNDIDFPFEWIWNISDNKKHAVKATVYDMAGNSASRSISTPKSHCIQQSIISQKINQLFKNILLRYQMRYM